MPTDIFKSVGIFAFAGFVSGLRARNARPKLILFGWFGESGQIAPDGGAICYGKTDWAVVGDCFETDLRPEPHGSGRFVLLKFKGERGRAEVLPRFNRGRRHVRRPRS